MDENVPVYSSIIDDVTEERLVIPSSPTLSARSISSQQDLLENEYHTNYDIDAMELASLENETHVYGSASRDEGNHSTQ